MRWGAALVWVAGSAGFLLAGMRLRSIHARASGLVSLLVAGILETWDYCLGMHEGYFLLLNGRFLAALAAILVVFAYAFVYRRSKEVCPAGEKRLSNALYGIGVLLLPILASAETWQWLAFHDHYYIARCLLPFLWLGGTAGYLGGGIRLRSVHLRVAGVVVLAVAAILAAIAYGHDAPTGYLVCLNWRFAAGLGVPLMAFIYALLRRLRRICLPGEQVASTALYGIGIFLLTILASVETWLWLDMHGYHYLLRCLLPLIWLVATASYLGAGLRLRSVGLRGAGLAILAVAGILAGLGYGFGMEGGYVPISTGASLQG